MRVALVVRIFPVASETFIVSHFLGLLARGVDVHVVCGRCDHAAWSAFRNLTSCPEAASRVQVAGLRRGFGRVAGDLLEEGRRRPARTLRQLTATGSGPSFGAPVRFLRKLPLLGLRADVVHFEFGWDALDDIWIQPALDCPVVVSLRGADLNYHRLQTPDAYREVWDAADAIHCLGEDLWRRAVARGCPPDKLHRLISPAVDTDFFSPDSGARGSPDVPTRLLSIGRLHWKKGYEHALAAVHALVEQGHRIEYRIVGDGTYEPAIRACINDFALSDVVRLVGAVPLEGVRSELRAADVLIHAAVSEGFGNAPLEAQAVGIPVVATDADGLAEAVADGISGFIVPRRDPKTLASRLGLLVSDPVLRRRLGAAGRRRMLDEFRQDLQIERFLELYEAAIRTHAARSSDRAAPVPALDGPQDRV